MINYRATMNCSLHRSSLKVNVLPIVKDEKSTRPNILLMESHTKRMNQITEFKFYEYFTIGRSYVVYICVSMRLCQTMLNRKYKMNQNNLFIFHYGFTGDGIGERNEVNEKEK